MIVHIINQLDCKFEIKTNLLSSIEGFKDVREICAKYSVAICLDIFDGEISFNIPPQKITLEEVNMNTLFFEVLNVYFNIKCRYMSLGGEGCEMAFEVSCDD